MSQACFTEGTQVVVGMEYDENGNFVSYVTANIEDIQAGDYVYSYNTLTGETELCEVTQTYVRTADHINILTVEDENGIIQAIETTDSHPFWVVTDDPDLERAARDVVDENGVTLYHENLEPGLNGFWVEAKDLRVGDVFLGANGELSTLVQSCRMEHKDGITVYNFEVADNHNYFIIAKDDEHGQACLLVHNAGYKNWSKGRHYPKNDAEKEVMQKVIDTPNIGDQMQITLNDPYCPAGAGYRKFVYIEGNIEVHYVQNIFTDPPQALDIKFKNP